MAAAHLARLGFRRRLSRHVLLSRPETSAAASALDDGGDVTAAAAVGAAAAAAAAAAPGAAEEEKDGGRGGRRKRKGETQERGRGGGGNRKAEQEESTAAAVSLSSLPPSPSPPLPAGVWAVDGALPPALLTHLRDSLFGAASPFWVDHRYPDPMTGYFSYHYPLTGETTTTITASPDSSTAAGHQPAIEAAIDELRVALSEGDPELAAALGGAAAAEWWAHSRSPHEVGQCRLTQSNPR